AVGPAAITLIVLDVLLLAALVVIMATWPDTSRAEEEPTPSASTSAAATSDAGGSGEGEETTQADAVEVPEDALDVAGFIMPSGNIWCQLADESTQCVIENFNYS